MAESDRGRSGSVVAESANFAEALQMVHDMNASMTPVGAVDRVENSILEEIELEEEEHASHRAAEERPKSGERIGDMRPKSGERIGDKLDPILGSTDHLPVWAPKGADKPPPSQLTRLRRMMPTFSECSLSLGVLLLRELAGATLLLAVPVAVILVEAPSKIDPRCMSLSNCTGAVTGPKLYAEPDDSDGWGPDDDIRLAQYLILWIARPLYSLAAARLLSLVVISFLSIPSILRTLPGIVVLLLHSIFSMPLCPPAILFPATNGVFRLLYFDRLTWKRLYELPSFVPASMWMLAAALAFCLLDAAVQFSQNQLALKHYEDRSQSAYEQQAALRKVAAAAKSCERRRAYPMWPSPRDAAGEGLLSRHLSGLSKLQQQLQRLAGPLDLGSGLAEAASLCQARRRAQRIFNLLLREEGLVTLPPRRTGRTSGEKEEPSVDRDALLRWAYQGDRRPPPPKLAADLFPYGQLVDRDQFCKVVERSYKEQRLLTASVESFDRLQKILLRGLQVLVAFIFLVLLLRLPFIRINLVSMLIPLTSALLVFFSLAGGLVAEVFSSFFFTYVTRPYDIGDRVYVATPGQGPVLYSLIVKDIEVMRTHFLTANGEAMVVSNSSVKNMALTNLSRSGKLTLLVQLMVPVATQSSKINELLEAITSYVSDGSGDWSACDNQFGEAALDKGHLLLNIWPTSVYAAHEIMAIYAAKSRLLLFCHAYMQAANIEYIMPVLPMRDSPGPRAGLAGVVEQALSAAAVGKLTAAKGQGDGGGGGLPFGLAAKQA